ncbi:MAG: cell division ATP-binding protein FtsE [Bacteroidota bacterium]|jgi:cell division transport system ATP-binding protein|nr:cell division ATP-binding protein FtsE [Ignavibacteria bacterium]MCU7499861.1 cell division ATP-binding protein FtsE [Ignavibacteria bacterium]MCU7511840.1 cell division ATP-binding protein FtsE [Ignavibacteria bacterium]MCU7519959.1 cell division ATP-binding protein FtsE [Ignavibacteria bacterium]MCU7523034.1 cell division ATP-binding protein FtsE [Ignavibacteria bacterium]
MLVFNNVSFSYSKQPVFENLNFRLDEGEFTFLIGKSGAGKSTFLQLIYMNVRPDKGTVRFNEYDSSILKDKNLPDLRRKIGIVFQDFRLLMDRNVYDNLAFVLEVTGTPRKQIKRKVFKALAEVGLSHKQMSMPYELSGGEQQRVSIARAIINDPMLILADEPTGNLDPETSLEIMELFKKLNARGNSVIFATHNYDLVRKFSAGIIKLEGGRALKVTLKQKSSTVDS